MMPMCWMPIRSCLSKRGILDEALEAGINFIDTADVYGTEQSPDIQQGSGLSEEIIGRWLQQGGRRERIVLATKVYQPMGPGPNDRRLSLNLATTT